MNCLKIRGRRPEPGSRNPGWGIRDSAGFTLVEVMIAMAIIGVTAVVLLQQRIEIVRDAARARDMRTSWILTSQKLAELELDTTLWTGAGMQSNGDFSEVSPDTSAFYWEYQIVREPIDLGDPKDPKAEKKPRDLLRLTLAVRAPGTDEPIVVEAQFPIYEPPKTPPPGTSAEAGNPPGTTPQPPGGTPGTGGRK